MKALILNSGLGSRMGDITNTHPKCMTKIDENETILSRQLKILKKCNIKEIIITTGYCNNILQDYCNNLNTNLNIKYVYNPKYQNTNYIYSIYCARDYLQDDVIIMHGDLIFTTEVLEEIIKEKQSAMIISSTLPLPEKDFKSVIINNKIEKIGIDYFKNAVSAQPLYKINNKDWKIWLQKIIEFCENGNVKCYAENAFNEVSDKCIIHPLDIKNKPCFEIDTKDDLKKALEIIKNIRSK